MTAEQAGGQRAADNQQRAAELFPHDFDCNANVGDQCDCSRPERVRAVKDELDAAEARGRAEVERSLALANRQVTILGKQRDEARAALSEVAAKVEALRNLLDVLDRINVGYVPLSLREAMAQGRRALVAEVAFGAQTDGEARRG